MCSYSLIRELQGAEHNQWLDTTPHCPRRRPPRSPLLSPSPLPSTTTPSNPPPPPRYMDKVLSVQLNGSRRVTGVLRGFDAFLNIVMDDAKEELVGGGKEEIGQVVIRGNSVVQFECLGLVERQVEAEA